jgi:hypothetical protein
LPVVGGLGDRATETRFGGLTLLLTPGPASTMTLAIGSSAAWPTDAKNITEIIDFIILTVNLGNLAIARLYFRP